MSSHYMLYDSRSVLAEPRTCPCCDDCMFVRPRMVGIEHPYVECSICGTWVQHPAPDFKYESAVTQDKGHLIGPSDHDANAWIAQALLERTQAKAVLDVGTRYPLLLAKLADRGVPAVLGIDGCGMVLEYGKQLGVPTVQGDFLEHDFGVREFDLVTMVHVLEHFVKPEQALAKVASLVGPTGYFYVRTPDAKSKGIVRHLSPQHYEVHPLLFSRAGVWKLFESHGNWKLVDEWGFEESGVMDFLFRRAA